MPNQMIAQQSLTNTDAGVTTLLPADRAELLTLVNRAYQKEGTARFEHYAPRLVRDMSCFRAIRQSGKLIAAAGVYPMTLQLGERQLRVAGIGAVACDPDWRGQGLMSRLLTHINAELRDQQYHLSVLGGQRQRYANHGWERAGQVYDFTFTAASMRHALRNPQPLTLVELDPANDAQVAAAHALHDQNPTRFLRDRDAFVHSLTHWASRPLLAFAGMRVAGYLIVQHQDENTIVELASMTPDDTTDILAAYAASRSEENRNRALHLLASPWQLAQLQRLGEVCEGFHLTSCNLWQVVDWSAVLDACLRCAHATRTMIPGEVVVGIEGHEPIRLHVEPDAAWAQSAPGALPEVSLPATVAARILLGPIRPSAVSAVVRRNLLLEAWCPLPLFLPRQDAV